MIFLGSLPLSLRLKLSFAWAVATSVIVMLGCTLLLFLVMTKRQNDLDHHLKNLAHQIISIPQIRAYLAEVPNAPKEEEIQPILNALLQDNPFIQEIIIINQFSKVLFRVSQPVEAAAGIAPSSIPPNGTVKTNDSSLPVENGEAFISLSNNPNEDLGMLRVRWRPEATQKFSRVLNIGAAYISCASFVLSFLFSYFFLLRAYTREQHRMTKALSLIVGGDYSQRLDTQSYPKGISEIGVHINRILSELEEERKKSQVLDHTLRQVEKGCTDYRKTLSEKSRELTNLRQDLRQGLLVLFEVIWNGLLIVDDEYKVHYMNDPAERLLRFARFDDSTLVDERLRKCLSPLVRSNSADRIDDLCVWPQKTMGHSVSCRVRAAQIPTGDGSQLFFVLLREESGFPKYHGSSYFSERLVLDVLANQRKAPSLILASEEEYYNANELEQRFRGCLRKIEVFRDLEEGLIGPITTIRLPIWLRDHFKADDLFSNNLNIDAQMAEMDIALHVPESLLSEMVDSLIYIVSQATSYDGNKKTSTLSVRPSVDSRGKPVISFNLPRISRKRVAHLQEVIEERAVRISEGAGDGPLTLDDLEEDITFSIYRLVRRLLRAQVECVFSENKQMATVRMVIENHSFPQPPAESNNVEPSASDPVRNLVREFLNGGA